HPSGNLGEGLQSTITQRGDELLLPPVPPGGSVPPDGRTPPDGRLDERFEGDLQPWPGTTAGDGVRSDQRTSGFIPIHHRRSPPQLRPVVCVCCSVRSAQHAGGGPWRRGQRVTNPVDQQ